MGSQIAKICRREGPTEEASLMIEELPGEIQEMHECKCAGRASEAQEQSGDIHLP